MKYLIFDLSPIAKPKDYNAPFTDTFSWPRMIHLSWIVLNDELKPISNFNYIIDPEGFTIDHHIQKYARLDEIELKKKGTKLEEVLDLFTKSVEEVDYLIAHNMNMNECVLAAEYMRKNIHPPFFTKERICLMQESTYFCKIPTRGGGYKWPSLQELYSILFNQKYALSNNARADTIAAARSFIMLMKKGELEDIFED
ncbi:MAG: hypothetical protein V3V14_12385 [Saprospiraceae bacterium]